MDIENYNSFTDIANYCAGATTIATACSLGILWICRTRQTKVYRRYIIVYILSNLVDSIVYKLTYVNIFAWHESVVFYSDGYFAGPRAIGAQMIFSSLPTAILTLLNLYRYAQVSNFMRFEFLSSPFSILFLCFLLSLDALFHYTVTTILFQTDGAAIDQSADLFFWVLNKGRDFGFEQCVGTYWIEDEDTFENGNWKPILGLWTLHVYYFSVIVGNVYISYKIRKAQRTNKLFHFTAQSINEPRHEILIWTQMTIVITTVWIPRMFVATLPFFHDVHSKSDVAARLSETFAMITVPLRPILCNFTVLIVIRDIRKHIRMGLRRSSTNNITNITVKRAEYRDL